MPIPKSDRAKPASQAGRSQLRYLINFIYKYATHILSLISFSIITIFVTLKYADLFRRFFLLLLTSLLPGLTTTWEHPTFAISKNAMRIDEIGQDVIDRIG